MNMVINTKLSIVDYVSLVDAIADGYFDFNGEYQPHIGLANTMRLFYNMCVVSSRFDTTLPHDFTDILLVDKIAQEEDFVTAFNDALSFKGRAFDFANAYNDAYDIVKTKKDSYMNIIQGIKTALISAIDSVKDMMTQDNLDKAVEIARDISSGKIDYSKIMHGFVDSPEFNQIINSEKGDSVPKTNESNVIPIESHKTNK